MGVAEKIKEIQDEMARTQKNKATNSHIGRLKAKLAKLRSELLAPPKSKGKLPLDRFVCKILRQLTKHRFWQLFNKFFYSENPFLTNFFS